METKPSNMRLPPDILRKLEGIQKKRNVSKTQATCLSIKIAHTILHSLDRDGAISIVRSDGTIEKIILLL